MGIICSRTSTIVQTMPSRLPPHSHTPQKESHGRDVTDASDIVDEPRTMLPPIDGYQHVLLMPLERAVQSLEIFDLLTKVHIAKSNCQKLTGSLTQDEAASIYLYTMEWSPKNQCLYYLLNHALRYERGEKFKRWFPYLKLLLTALYKLPSVKGTL
ncbi:unnamed protein product [Didymodactylos carnosus]|uniref:Uncharacterized protein n=1 Tax=Didymodactylos carnosus TaxID=1234261 RepID=A0A8S2FZQ0_9BILA|nr:unnamed protein product [Didymodactylos carnosus]CAF4370699.1 unnamed protein product [Didymodactylos carnosus]